MHADPSGHSVIGTIIWVLIYLVGVVLATDVFIQALSSVMRNPTAGNIFMLVVASIFLVLAIVDLVSSIVNLVNVIKAPVNAFQTTKIAVQNADDAVAGTVDIISKKPMQEHHFLTNKNKKYTPQFEKITTKYNLDLDGAWNKQLMRHQGRHPNAYHEYMLENLVKIDKIAKGNKHVFLKKFGKVKQFIIDNPILLTKAGWPL